MSQTTASIRFLEDENNHVLLPVTHERGVVDSEGITLETKLAQKQATITQVNVTVDNNTGTPSGTASVSGGTLTLSFSNLKGATGATGATGTTGATGPQGPKGDQGNTGSSVGYPYELVNNLTTDDATKGLSAAQGKLLKDSISLILDSLGEYAFPNGRPTLPWETVKYDITASLTNIASSNPAAKINEGDSYTTILSSTNEQYAVDDSQITVSMGGVDVTSTVCQNGVINIPEVTGNIVITAQAITYVQSGLVFRLDGKNRGGSSGHWIDEIGLIDFALTNCTEESDGVVFNGTTSKGESSGVLSTLFTAGTIEVVYDASNSGYPTTYPQCILTNSTENGICFALTKRNSQNNIYGYAQAENAATILPTKSWGYNDVSTEGSVSISFANCYANGVLAPAGGNDDRNSLGRDSSTTLALGYRHRSSGDNYYKGKIFEIRVYSRQLTQAEILNNYIVDSKRYTI